MKLALTPVPLESHTIQHRTNPRPLSVGHMPSQTFAYDASCEATVGKSRFAKMNL